MQEHAPKSQDQGELYDEVTRDYATVTKADYEEAKRVLRETGRWPEGFGFDYLLMATFEGVEYWLPNDEEWFDVIAVDHVNQLARATGFCEMNDFIYEDSDYRNVMDPSDGKLKCKFEIAHNEDFDNGSQ